MLHATFLLAFMLVAAPLAGFVPMASLAAVLVVVAWNMAEVHRFRLLLRGPLGDRVVLLATFALTVAVDLTVAIEVGVVLAAVLFMHRMSQVGGIGAGLAEEDEDDLAQPRSDRYSQRDALPRGVEVFQLRGPLFFGVASRLSDVIDAIGVTPRVFILRMREVPLVDASGAARLQDFVAKAQRQGTRVILSGLQPGPEATLRQMGIRFGADDVALAADFTAALATARAIVGVQ
jgi:SulP family sulfate permease